MKQMSLAITGFEVVTKRTRYRGLAKNTCQLLLMFALSNLWMMRKRILQGIQA